MPDPLVAEFIADEFPLGKERAENKKERRQALTWCLNNDWKSADVDTLERIDDEGARMFGWALWRRA